MNEANSTPDPADPTVRRWRCLSRKPGPDYRIFDVRLDELENPRNQEVMTRVVLETPEWVNVVARTAGGEYVVIRQFRFATESVTCEIPGGMVDPGEDSRSAAERELREETGYVAREWHYLGCVEPNPAFLNNLCHTWLAEGVEQSAAMEQDLGEDIQVATMTEDALRAAIVDGEIRHVLVLSALARVLDLRSASLAKRPAWVDARTTPRAKSTHGESAAGNSDGDSDGSQG